MEVIHYLTRKGIDPFQKWFDSLQDLQAQVVILRRIDRLARGSLGDCKFCGEGIWEPRIDFGPGYRIYYAKTGRATILLLQGGSKRTQGDDVDRASGYWRDFNRRRQQHDS